MMSEMNGVKCIEKKNVTKKTTNKKTFRKMQIISFCVEAGLRLFLAVIRKQSSENQHACVWNYKHFLFGFSALDIQLRALGRLCGTFRSNPHLFAFNVWICSYLKASIWTCVMTPAQACPTSVLVLVAFEAQMGAGPQWLARQSTVRPRAAASPVTSVLCWCIEWAPMPKHHFTFLGLLKCPYFNKKVHFSCFLCTQTKKRKTKHKIHMM